MEREATTVRGDETFVIPDLDMQQLRRKRVTPQGSFPAIVRADVYGRGYKAAKDADPKNLLFHHHPLKRLEGEAIRDSLLAISGRLDRTQFGKPVPVHLTAFMDGRGRPGASGPLDLLLVRRSDGSLLSRAITSRVDERLDQRLKAGRDGPAVEPSLMSGECLARRLVRRRNAGRRDCLPCRARAR